MNKKSLHRALLSALLLGSTTAMATGFEPLSSGGVPVGNNGLSAYTLCNLTGEFGSDEEGSIPPTFEPEGGSNNACAIPKIPEGYKQIKNARRAIKLLGLNKRLRPVKITIGHVTDRVWRNKIENSCIYGAKVRLSNTDADRLNPGKQYFEVNDILRGGFENKIPEAAYWYSKNADEVIYRVGLTSTSLVFEPESESEAQPLIDEAPIDANWVDFSTDINYRDDDGSSYRDSPWLLVKTACTAEEKPVVLPGVLKFRQMGQEGQPLKEIEVNGYAPPGATTEITAP
jgi:hypothetical protein